MICWEALRLIVAPNCLADSNTSSSTRVGDVVATGPPIAVAICNTTIPLKIQSSSGPWTWLTRYTIVALTLHHYGAILAPWN